MKSFYDEICEIDIISPIKHLNMSIKWKLEPNLSNSPERPWLNAAHCPYRDCALWHDFYFKYYKIVPNGCRNCWKIVLHPKNLVDLFKVYDLQKKMATPSKCGIEKRGYSGRMGRYAAFWYCPIDCGLQGARDHFEMVKKKVDHLFGMHEHNLFLKRGCTEMENFTLQNRLGGSDEWDRHAESFDKVEKMLEQIFIPSNTIELHKDKTPWFIDNYVKRRWIEWAFEHNDQTYLKYTGEKPLMHTHVKYNDSIHSNIDHEPTFDKGKAYEQIIYHYHRSEDAQEGEAKSLTKVFTDDCEPEPKLTVL